MLTDEKLADARMKHLEFLLAAIGRMSTYSASTKTYCVTLSAAVAGFALTLKMPSVFGWASLLVVLFAVLDAQYLRTERRLRAQFDEVRAGDWSMLPTFEMLPTKSASLAGALMSWSICLFYVPVVLMFIGAALFAKG